MKKLNIVIFLLAAALAGNVVISQARAVSSGDTSAAQNSNTARKTKIGMKRARAIALNEVPGGRIKSAELERENGNLIYSFDIRVANGIKEVQVEAYTGKVLEVKDESAVNEAAEKRNDRKRTKP
ncbi:MAG TPA: peptidase M4 [Blastocatellia bacterium]|nr:peptidase M4 [Blastocatellia bacterium]HAF21521.1 peptidase M4 [Blastocatellia bacterium]